MMERITYTLTNRAFELPRPGLRAGASVEQPVDDREPGGNLQILGDSERMSF